MLPIPKLLKKNPFKKKKKGREKKKKIALEPSNKNQN